MYRDNYFDLYLLEHNSITVPRIVISNKKIKIDIAKSICKIKHI